MRIPVPRKATVGRIVAHQLNHIADGADRFVFRGITTPDSLALPAPEELRAVKQQNAGDAKGVIFRRRDELKRRDR